MRDMYAPLSNSITYCAFIYPMLYLFLWLLENDEFDSLQQERA